MKTDANTDADSLKRFCTVNALLERVSPQRFIDVYTSTLECSPMTSRDVYEIIEVHSPASGSFVDKAVRPKIDWIVQLPPDDPAAAEPPELSSLKAAAEFVQAIQAFLNAGMRDAAVDAVYDQLDTLLLKGSFERARLFLQLVAQNPLPLSVLVSALTVTLPWRDVLGDARSDLALEVHRRAVTEGGPQKARALLDGLL